MTVWVDMNGFVNPNLLAVAWWMLGGGVLALAFGVGFAVAARQAYLPKYGIWMRFVLQASIFIFVGIVLIFKALFNPPITPKFSLNHHAAFVGDIEAVKQHLAEGADVNAKDASDATPLHFAAGGSSGTGHKEIAELLIAGGADVNAKDEFGETPLDWAIRFKHPEVADLLRKHGGKRGAELKAEGK